MTDADDPVVTLSDGIVTLGPWSRDDAPFMAEVSADRWAVLLVLGVVGVCSWLTPRAWVWIAGSATLSIEAWFLWRAVSARTVGANLMGVGAFWILPFVVAGTFGPAYVASLTKRRRALRM